MTSEKRNIDGFTKFWKRFGRSFRSSAERRTIVYKQCIGCTKEYIMKLKTSKLKRKASNYLVSAASIWESLQTSLQTAFARLKKSGMIIVLTLLSDLSGSVTLFVVILGLYLIPHIRQGTSRRNKKKGGRKHLQAAEEKCISKSKRNLNRDSVSGLIVAILEHCENQHSTIYLLTTVESEERITVYKRTVLGELGKKQMVGIRIRILWKNRLECVVPEKSR